MDVYLSLFGLPATHPSLSRRCPWWSCSPALPPPADAFSFLPGIVLRKRGRMEEFGAGPLVLSGFSIRILERLHLGKGSRENKLQIPARMGKGLCSRSSLRELGRAEAGVALPLTDPTRSLAGPTEAARPPQHTALELQWCLFTGVVVLRSAVTQSLWWFCLCPNYGKGRGEEPNTPSRLLLTHSCQSFPSWRFAESLVWERKCQKEGLVTFRIVTQVLSVILPAWEWHPEQQ